MFKHRIIHSQIHLHPNLDTAEYYPQSHYFTIYRTVPSSHNRLIDIVTVL